MMSLKMMLRGHFSQQRGLFLEPEDKYIVVQGFNAKTFTHSRSKAPWPWRPATRSRGRTNLIDKDSLMVNGTKRPFSPFSHQAIPWSINARSSLKAREMMVGSLISSLSSHLADPYFLRSNVIKHISRGDVSPGSKSDVRLCI